MGTSYEQLSQKADRYLRTDRCQSFSVYWNDPKWRESKCSQLDRLGAKYNPLIIQGELWRLFTPMFIHIGLEHLALNLLTLYFLGVQLEQLFGKWRF